ncbi:MAG: FeoA domain-containing protein, partial [Duncaniella sp.]|nr:FeoA domain-containing protein [Duncaniella sp.]
MRLSQLVAGQTGTIIKILGHGAFRKRMIEMGFVRGHEIKVLMAAPLKDPVKYEIMGYEVSLRHAEADLVEVEPLGNPDTIESTAHTNTVTDHAHDEAHSSDDATLPPTPRHKVINVALIGNPNCGKTSLFNIASGAREHVGNYSGVTVDAKYGSFNYKGYRFNIVDLPGTYSLASYSPEELYVRRYLHNETPDVI